VAKLTESITDSITARKAKTFAKTLTFLDRSKKLANNVKNNEKFGQTHI